MPIPKECKRLAEVDFPIAVVSQHSAREKSIRHGHPSTLHLWWARRPLAACRAMLMALLLPDPGDPACPDEFRRDARQALLAFPGAPQGWAQTTSSNSGLREALLKFIGDFANWNVAASPHYLQAARQLVRAAHGIEPPLVVDPFAGGGSIPLEALRVGCDAFASDLNPVACLILKTMLEDIPRHGPGLADELREAGRSIKAAAAKELAAFYPADEDGSTPIAFIWARTVRCEGVGCGAEIPLVRSFWLSKKANRRRALRHTMVRHRGQAPSLNFEVYTPKSERDVMSGTVARAKATCPACQMVLAPDRVRSQLAAEQGGADVMFNGRGERTGGARLLAVVNLHEQKTGRQYRVATDDDYRVVWKAQKKLAKVAEQKLPNGLSPVPDEPLPPIGTLGFRVQRYGMLQWGDLFTARQKLALVTFCKLIAQRPNDATRDLLGVAFSGVVDRNASLSRWRAQADQEKVENVFARQALPITWDFAEAVPTSESTGGFADRVVATSVVVTGLAQISPRSATVTLADATSSGLPDASVSALFTDPPYYDAIPYADLSDFFFVWLRRSSPDCRLLRDPFDEQNRLTPKNREAVQDETRTYDGVPKDRAFFESVMAKAFREGRRVLADDGIGSVVFAHKTTEGWEALLGGLIKGGWILTGSWPIATEMATRLRARESAALGTSVHLVCRPREADAPIGDWSDVYRQLPKRVGDWMERLSAEGVRGADLVFACIGPAMEVYSRYSRVEDAMGREIPLGGDPEARDPYRRGFLAYVWEMVGRAALNQVLGTGEARPKDGASALEEDARLTALFLWTLQSTASSADSKDDRDHDDDDDESEDDEDETTARKGKKKGLTLIFDVVRRFAQPLGIHLDQFEGRIIATEKGVVRLLPVSDRAESLFGAEGATAVATRIEAGVRAGRQLSLDFIFDRPDEPEPKPARGRRSSATTVRDEDLTGQRGGTTLDRVHAAMLLQSAGRANALRSFLKAEVERGSEFLRLANALSALYPKDCEEKRLVDAMLLAVPR